VFANPGRRIDWIEISADYLCNNRCTGCFSSQDSGASMTTDEVFENLIIGRNLGARHLWLGGGEPTLRKDLLRIVRRARRLGYQRIRLETNGMMLAYGEFARACIEAGINEINFAIKGHAASLHDGLTRTPGSFELMMRGIEWIGDLAVPMEGDVLIYRNTARLIPDMVRFFTDAGIKGFNLWLFSAADQGPKKLANLVPRICDVVPFITRTLDLGISDDPGFVTSLHTPPCTIPESYRRCTFKAADLNLLVANPGGYRFMLEQSPIEGGHYLARCKGCGLRGDCGGIRLDYIEIHGDAEFQPEL